VPYMPTEGYKEARPLSKLDGRLHIADDKSVDWLSSYGTKSAYVSNNIAILQLIYLVLTASRVIKQTFNLRTDDTHWLHA